MYKVYDASVGLPPTLYRTPREVRRDISAIRDKINEINDPSIECLKLIDKDNSKNQSTLLQTGKQLLDRFKFISQSQ